MAHLAAYLLLLSSYKDVHRHSATPTDAPRCVSKIDSSPANTPLLLQHWANVVATLLPNIATMLTCRQFTTCWEALLPQRWVNIVPTLYQSCLRLYQCCGYVVWMLCKHWSPSLVTNIETTFKQRCVKVVATSLPNIGDRHGEDIQAMLHECCGNVAHRHWWPMLRQRSDNVAWTLWQCHSPMLVTNIEAMFRQCCMNVVAMSLPNVGDRWWDNILAMLREHCGNVTPYQGLMLRQCSDNTMLVPNVVPTLQSNIVLGRLRSRMTAT